MVGEGLGRYLASYVAEELPVSEYDTYGTEREEKMVRRPVVGR